MINVVKYTSDRMGIEKEDLGDAAEQNFKAGIGNKLPNPCRQENTDKFGINENNNNNSEILMYVTMNPFTFMGVNKMDGTW
jgi:hypothetical protein